MKFLNTTDKHPDKTIKEIDVAKFKEEIKSKLFSLENELSYF